MGFHRPSSVALYRLSRRRTARLVWRAEALVRDRRREFRPELVPTDDPRALSWLAERGAEAAVARPNRVADMWREHRPRSLTEAAAAATFWRPGPISWDIPEQFERALREPPWWPGPVGPILGPTRGVPVFVEQLEEIVRAVAGVDEQSAFCLLRDLRKRRPEAERTVGVILGVAKRPPWLGRWDADRVLAALLGGRTWAMRRAHPMQVATLAYRQAYLAVHHPTELRRAADAGSRS